MELTANTEQKAITPQQSTPVKTFKFNPLLPGFNANPYPIYTRLRTEDPIHQDIAGNWIVTRYADVKKVLEDKRFITDKIPERIQEKNRYIQDKQKDYNILVQTIRQWLMFLDPPEHTQLRGMVNKAFFLKTVQRMRPQIQKSVEQLINKVQASGQIDIIRDIASPLPVIVISQILGLPAKQYDRLTHLTKDLFLVIEPLLSLEDYERLNQTALEFRECLLQTIIARVKNPQEDLISFLIAARVGYGNPLTQETENDLLSICTFLFSAGEETTVNLIANGILALLHHPHEMERLKQQPQMIESAVEELLRYDSPVQFVARIATEEISLVNKTIQAEDRVLLCLGAANRDPLQFADPDQLNLTRSENRHLAFSDGIHYCLGATLARIEGQIAINTLVQKLPELSLVSETLTWQKNVVFRGLKALPLRFTPST
ncbi:MAG: cytochrome P450 [Microcystaceae cyanobacterium]